MFKTILCSIICCTSLLAAAQSPAFKHPVLFEPNRGQAPSQISWMARGASYQLFLAADGASIVVPEARQETAPRPIQPTPFQPQQLDERLPEFHLNVVRMKLEGSRSWNAVTGQQPTAGVSN